MPASDPVNHPAHYQSKSFEAIIVIEETIEQAPGIVPAYLQGQALKYVLRMWLKGESSKDAKKAVWYLNRLIQKLERE